MKNDVIDARGQSVAATLGLCVARRSSKPKAMVAREERERERVIVAARNLPLLELPLPAKSVLKEKDRREFEFAEDASVLARVDQSRTWPA